MHREGHLDDVYWALRVGLGSTAFLAGLDKFTNLLTDWEKYIAPQVRERLPISGKKFMYGVGVIEMLVGWEFSLGNRAWQATLRRHGCSALPRTWF
jgi:uncharacterized membrane protein YphA (DoxX/SURF4 family)